MRLSPTITKYITNIFWLAFEKTFGLFVGAVVGIYVARYLKPESFGLLNYSMSFVSIFAALATLGIDQIMVRELSRGTGRNNDLLGTGFILKGAGSLIVFVVTAVALLFMKHDSFTNILILIVASAELFKGFEVINYFFQAKVLSKFVAPVQLVLNLFISVLKIAMVFMHAPLIWFAIVVVVAAVLNAAGYYYSYRKKEGSVFSWRYSRQIATELLKESWPLALYGIALNIQARIDQVMLGQLMNNYQVGQYSVALKFIEIFGFVPVILMNTFMPAITKAKSISTDLYHSRLVNLYRIMFACFLAVSIPIYFFAKDVISLLYGPDYETAGYLLSLFALRLFFSNMGVAKSVFIINESLFRYSLLTVIVGAAANIIMNFLLIPAAGPKGAILASMFSFVISIFLVDLFFDKTRLNQQLMFKGIFGFWKLNPSQFE
jgi:O-antigen/teichoic acid export membrane protein